MVSSRDWILRKTPIVEALAATLLVCVHLPSQRPVITVGPTNATYTDLPTAVAAAVPGSVLQVRPGNYTGFSTNKPLRIVLDFTAANGSVQAPPGGTYAIEVNGLAAGQDFALVGRGALIGSGSIGAVRIANGAGNIVLDSLTLAAGTTTVGLDVQNSASLLVQNVTASGSPALQVQDAIVASSNVAWTGLGGTGIVALRGTLDFTNGSMIGHRAPALHVQDSVVRLAGNGSTAIAVNGGPPFAVAAFEAIWSDVHWQPADFVLTPAGAAPAFSSVGGQTITEQVPALVASCSPPGGAMTTRMTLPTPAAGLIVLGHLVRPHAAFGLPGVFWDQQSAAYVLAVGAVDNSGLSYQTLWPNVPWLLGELFCCQGAVLPASSALIVSGAVVWVAL